MEDKEFRNQPSLLYVLETEISEGTDLTLNNPTKQRLLSSLEDQKQNMIVVVNYEIPNELDPQKYLVRVTPQKGDIIGTIFPELPDAINYLKTQLKEYPKERTDKPRWDLLKVYLPKNQHTREVLQLLKEEEDSALEEIVEQIIENSQL
jgi:hypothetical protein